MSLVLSLIVNIVLKNTIPVFFAVYEKAERLCQEYAAAKGAGTTAKPQNHLFFRKLGPVVKRTLEKCDRENGLM